MASSTDFCFADGARRGCNRYPDFWFSISPRSCRGRWRRCCSPKPAPRSSRSSGRAARTCGTTSRASTARARCSRCSTAARKAWCSISSATRTAQSSIRCLSRADILVEQFRPGVMARLGLGYEAVRAINPKLIYCSITGYGQTGPRADEAGHDLNYIGYTGLLALNPGPPDRPVVPPALIADIAGGTLPAVMNILLALRQRDQTGQGCYLDIAMTDAMFTFAGHALASGQATGTVSRPGRRAAFRRLAALSDLSDARRPVRLLRGAGAEVLGGVHRRHRPRCEISSTTGAIRRPRRPRSRRSSRARPPTNGGRRLPRPTAASPSWRRWRRRLRDPHFVSRGLFAHKVAGPSGAAMAALPVPIDPQFRGDPAIAKAVPKLGDGT